MVTQKDIAKRHIEMNVINQLTSALQIPRIQAMQLFYNSTTYSWFADDERYGIAREGADAIFYRVLNELDGHLIA